MDTRFIIRICSLFLCLGILVACDDVMLTSSTTMIVETTVLGLSETSTPPVATKTPSPTYTEHPTTSSTPLSTVAETSMASPDLPEIISQENVHRITQIGLPFHIESFLVELAFRDDKTLLVESSGGQQIKIYDLSTQKEVATLMDNDASIEKLVISPDGKYLAAISPSKEKVSLWNLDISEKTDEFPLLGFESWSPSLFLTSPTGGEFSQNNSFLTIWGCRVPALNLQGLRVGCISSGVIVYDIFENEIYQELNGYQAATAHATFSPDNSLLILLGEGESILQADLYVWDVINKVKVKTFKAEYDDFFSDGKYRPDDLFVASSGGYLLTFDPTTWQLIKANRPKSHGELSDFVFSDASDLLVVDDLSGISFRDRDNQIIFHRVNLQIGFIFGLAISPDGRFVYTISEDGFIRKWGIP